MPNAMTIQEALRIGLIADRLARVSGERFHFDRQKLLGVGMTDDDIDELDARFRGGVETWGLWGNGKK